MVQRRSGGCWVSDEGYDLVLGAAERRAIKDRLPEAVATAVVNFMTSALVEEPHRVGKPLRGELAGLWSARRGTYRVVYRIDEDRRDVIVLRIEHRRDVYRPG